MEGILLRIPERNTTKNLNFNVSLRYYVISPDTRFYVTICITAIRRDVDVRSTFRHGMVGLFCENVVVFR